MIGPEDDHAGDPSAVAVVSWSLLEKQIQSRSGNSGQANHCGRRAGDGGRSRVARILRNAGGASPGRLAAPRPAADDLPLGH